MNQRLGWEGKVQSRLIEAAQNLEFEEAARLRDELRRIEDKELGLNAPGMPVHLSARAPYSGKAEIDAPIQPPSGRRPRR